MYVACVYLIMYMYGYTYQFKHCCAGDRRLAAVSTNIQLEDIQVNTIGTIESNVNTFSILKYRAKARLHSGVKIGRPGAYIIVKNKSDSKSAIVDIH